VEHLGKVVRCCIAAQMGAQAGAKGVQEQALTAECDRRIDEAKAWMWEGKVRELLRCISKLPQVTAEAAECVRQTLQYYRNNSSRMRYDVYRAKGLRIGSGSMESACKQVVTARLKGAGMRWSQVGAQGMGHLRALYLSTGRWEQVVGQWPGRGMSAVPSC